jgi:hypothetical protein
MTLSAAVDQLWQAVHQLREDSRALRLVAVEDRPVGEPSKLVDDVGAASDTLAGWVEELLAGAAGAAAAAGSGDPADQGRLRRALDRAGATLERAAAQFLEDLATVRRFDELGAFAHRGGSESRAWVEEIRQAIDRTQSSLWAAQVALTTCWRELADRVGTAYPPSASAATERRS